jgi:hypothetical protein
MGNTRHNHDGGQALPFGRKLPQGECPRCDELRAGAPARADHAAGRRGKRDDYQPGDYARHRATCDRCRTGGVCTAYEW